LVLHNCLHVDYLVAASQRWDVLRVIIINMPDILLTMVDKALIPFAGDKKVRKRLRELDKEFASLMVLIGIGFSKIFEAIVDIFVQIYPFVTFGVDISDLIWWTLYTLAWCIVFIYELDQVASETADDIRDTVDEVREE